jgi:SAM-dependent methyltransferase
VSAVPPAAVATEEPPCPLCADASPPTRLLRSGDVATDWPGEYGIVRCGACGLAFTSPRPTPSELGRFYEAIYAGDNAGEMRRMQTEGGSEVILRARWRSLRKIVRDAGGADGPGTRLLDVGCGYGGFLRAAGEGGEWQLSGCDTSAGSIEGTVAPASAKLVAADVADAGYPEDHFDVVTLYHCLEHTPAPVAELAEAHRILKPGGLALVEVPHFGGLWRRPFGRYWFPLLLPQHLNHFEMPTLRRAFVDAGFGQVVLQRGAWAPIELVFSMGLLLKAIFGKAPEGRRPVGKWLLHKLLGLGLTAAFFFVDLPLSLLLARTRLSGHHVAVARKIQGRDTVAP